MPDLLSPFASLPPTARSHFQLHLYAVIYRLVDFIRSTAGKQADDFFSAFPFLSATLDEAVAYMSEDIKWRDGARWWRAHIADWEASIDGRLPLLSLPDLDYESRLALAFAGLVEEDTRFGTLFAHLQSPLVARRPSLELLAQVVTGDRSSGISGSISSGSSRELIGAGLLEVLNMDAPRAEWLVRIPPALWEIVRGEPRFAPPAGGEYQPPDEFPEIDDLILPEEERRRLAQIPGLVSAGRVEAILVRATPGSDARRVTGALARAMDRGVLYLDGSAESTLPCSPAAGWPAIGPFCSMAGCMPAIAYSLGPGEVVEVPRLGGYTGPVALLLGMEGGVRGAAVEKSLTLALPAPRPQERLRSWQEALGGFPAHDLEAISSRFHLPDGYIRQAAGLAAAYAALDRREAVELGDVQAACRSLNHQLLDSLAARLETEGDWERLILSPAATARLKELEQRCRQREKLLDHLGPAFGGNHNRGVRALFSGGSGTGKTLAARILASQLGMDLYRVDLAAVINKYIGETEKNLSRILARAEELDVILLLDEGDALLGARTEVRTSNDRYANLETDYLLQRLETYQGIVLVTTNAGENIDRAFQRRMDVVVSFIPPQALERLQIWELHLPAGHRVPERALENVAVRCELTGGQIRNAALSSALLALDAGVPVGKRHLEAAVRSEYRKAGAVCPLSVEGAHRRSPASLEAFLDALA